MVKELKGTQNKKMYGQMTAASSGPRG